MDIIRCSSFLIIRSNLFCIDILQLPSNQRLQHRPTVVMQQMDLVNNHQSHKLCVCALSALARDNVPFLGSADNDLCGIDLFLAQLVVTGQFIDRQAI